MSARSEAEVRRERPIERNHMALYFMEERSMDVYDWLQKKQLAHDKRMEHREMFYLRREPSVTVRLMTADEEAREGRRLPVVEPHSATLLTSWVERIKHLGPDL